MQEHTTWEPWTRGRFRSVVIIGTQFKLIFKFNRFGTVLGFIHSCKKANKLEIQGTV